MKYHFGIEDLARKLSKQCRKGYLREEVLRGAKIGDGFLIRRSDGDDEVATSVEVIFVSQNLAGELDFVARVPFCRESDLESISIVNPEISVCLWLSEDVGCNLTLNIVILVHAIVFVFQPCYIFYSNNTWTYIFLLNVYA